jgi:tetratricopeptide (TPR) repeat protein
MSSIVEKREPLTDYPRSADAALGTVEVSDANRREVERRRGWWATYLRCTAQPEAPVSVQYAPLLLDLVLNGADRLPFVPGSLYPASFRRQVLSHTAWPENAMWHEPSARDEDGLPFLARLRAVLEPDSDAPASTLVSLAQLLNVLGLYGSTVRSLGRRASGLGDVTLFYEVARAAYWLEPDTDRAIRPFQLLAQGSEYPLLIRLTACTRLIAHYCRRDRDLVACAEWADTARRLVDGAQADSFEMRLAISRIYRALALYAVRRRDQPAVMETMGTTHGIATELVAGASTPAESVAAAQDLRLVLEASLKAFVSSRGRAAVIDPQGAVDRLLAIDPWDPYTELITGDALWMLGQDERAAERFQMGGSLGTFPGALSAQRAGVVLRSLGRQEEADAWFARAAELDPAASAEPS